MKKNRANPQGITCEELALRLRKWATEYLLGEDTVSPYPLDEFEVTLIPLAIVQRERPATPKPANVFSDLRELVQSAPRDVSRSVTTIHQSESLIESLRAELSKLAHEGSAEAAESLARLARDATADLSSLGRDRCELVRQFSPEWPVWPVLYDGRPDTLDTIQGEFAKLLIGTQAAQRHHRPSDQPSDDQPFRHEVAKYAQRIGRVLLILKANEHELRIAFGRRPGSCPDWLRELIWLPPLTKDTAADWFNVGWKILSEGSGGNVSSILELAPVGASNAKFAESRATTSRGEGGPHTSRRNSAIRKALCKAFISRFGN